MAHRSLTPLITSAALAICAAQSVAAQETAGTPPPPTAAPEPTHGFVHVVVFAGGALQLVAGATVTVDGSGTAATNERGSVFVPATSGQHALRVQIGRASLPGKAATERGVSLAEVNDVVVMPGDVTRVLVAFGAEGDTFDADVRVPKASAPPPAEAPAEGEPAAGEPGSAGSVSGRVVSSEGKPIAGAQLYVLGSPAETQTDADGQFKLALPEGVYAISIVHVDYMGQTLEGVVVQAGAALELPIKLEPAPAEIADFVVRARRIRGSVATVMEDRREASSVTDAIGAEDIRKSPDGTASAATRRVVGATVVGGQYLFVRGLGGRYSNVRLNGVPLPSTDPDVPGFQLDLFPASLLSSLTIAKTFTPDIPGDFAGGSMNIVTRDFPERFDATASMSLTSDTETIGRDMQSYDGGDFDFLGFDDGTRALPDAVPEDTQVIREGRRVMGGVSDERRAEIGRSFPNTWEVNPRFAPPTLSLGFSLGDTTQAAGNRLGYLFTLGYRYASNRYIENIINTRVAPEGSELPVEARETLRREVGKESAQIGMLGSLSYELAKGHDITSVSVFTQTGDDEASAISGHGESEGMEIHQSELTFIERQLLFNQLLGVHDFKDLILDWQLNMANVQREQPDSRGLIYVEGPNGDFLFSQTSGSGERFFTDLSQIDVGGGANLTVPIAEAKVEGGYLGRASDRDFEGRRFKVDPVQRSDADLALPPEELFAPETWGDEWLIKELTAPEDGYSAEQELHAGYGLVDVPIAGWLRLTGGARVESYHQLITVEPPVPTLVVDTEDATPDKADRTDTDGLPAGAAILSLSDSMSVRLAYGGTVARPAARELAPFRVQDFVRRRTVQGDLDLKRTYIHNFDVRWEFFPTPTEVLAVSGFYKIFLDPIEAVILDAAGNLTFDNAESAQNYGIELEARTGMGRFADALEDLVLSANFAWIQSQITLTDEQSTIATSKERPLAGQSPYVINVSLGYSPSDTGLTLNLFYNVFGRRIIEVGRLDLPDVYEEPFHSLDFTASLQLGEHWTLGATATNLLLQEVVVEQGGLEVSRINRGASFGLRLGFAN